MDLWHIREKIMITAMMDPVGIREIMDPMVDMDTMMEDLMHMGERIQMIIRLWS